LVKNPFGDERSEEVEAIVDTGASCICVGRRLARDLALTRTGATRMVAVGADHPAGVYAAKVIVPELDFDKFLPVCAPDGVNTSATILLGRTFLEFFDFSYNGQAGTFAFHNDGDRVGASHHEFEE